MILCKESIEVGNDLPIEFEMEQTQENQNFCWNYKFSKREYSLLFDILKAKTIMQIARSQKLKKEIVINKIIELFQKLGINLNSEFIENNLGHKILGQLIIFYYSFGIFHSEYNDKNIKELSTRIDKEEYSRRNLFSKDKLSEFEINMLKGISEGRRISEIENAIKWNNQNTTYQKVIHKILAKTNSNNIGQAVYKAVKLSLI